MIFKLKLNFCLGYFELARMNFFLDIGLADFFSLLINSFP